VIRPEAKSNDIFSTGTANLTLENLLSNSDSRLPASYELAVAAIAKASGIDECRDLSDKAMALASNARQSRDDCLQRMAIRTQAGATCRCGARTDLQPGDTTDLKLTRASAATDAGMSERQRKTALGVASVSKADSEQPVENEKPPTVTKRAEQGKKTRALVGLDGIDPADFAATTQVQGSLNRFADYCRCDDPVRVAGAFMPHERKACEIRTPAERQAHRCANLRTLKWVDVGNGCDRRSLSSDTTVKPAKLPELGITRD
jgi:hypothetical protein